MTDIRAHVPDLETCKLLRDAGFPQETCFIWREAPESWVEIRVEGKYYTDEPVAAPLATEIMRQVDDAVLLEKQDDGRFFANKTLPSWLAIDLNPATACAMMWLRLREEKVK